MNIFKRKEKEDMRVPRSVQEAIPIQKLYFDGTFYLGKNKYSNTYKFTDINYQVANKSDKEDMFLSYSELLKSLDSNQDSKITIINRKLNKNDFAKTMLMKPSRDGLNKYRNEYNKMITDKAENSNEMIQEKYITLTCKKKTYEETKPYFNRVEGELQSHLSKLNSKAAKLGVNDRLKLLYSFYRNGEEEYFDFDIKDNMKKGHSFKDYISPNYMQVKSDYLMIGDRYARVLFLKDYATYIKDNMIAEFTELNKSMMLSIDCNNVPMDEAMKDAEKRRLNVETTIAQWQRKQNENNNFSAVIPYDLEQQRQESKEFLDDLATRNQRMFLCALTIIHTAETKEELDNDTEYLQTVAKKHLCQLAILKFEQLEGLNTVLPIGHKKIHALRTLTTESLAVLMPFRVQEVNDEKGIYYGQNVISKNMIIADRRRLLNGNSFILGVSGSGKSFTAKQEITSIMLRDPNADIIIIDPEAEYSSLVKALGGEVINISSTSTNHINAMDIGKSFKGESERVIMKSEFILSLCDQLLGDEQVTAGQKTVIDRCIANIFRDYKNNPEEMPTLKTFREELQKQPEREAKEIALSIELFTDGSLNTFAKPTNVDTDNRLICYDILELGKQLQPIGMLVILDSIFNRIQENREKGRSTFIFIDEIYLLFQHKYSANFLFTLWKRVRKYGAFCTGITQNISDLLQSHTACTMLSNSEFIVMLNQASTDRLELANLLKISEQELSFITNVSCGQGLIKIENSLIPFINEFPKDTELYRLMTTKQGEW